MGRGDQAVSAREVLATEWRCLTEGRSSAVRINIPCGGQALAFGGAAAAALSRSPWGTQRVLATAFDGQGDQSVFPTCKRGSPRMRIIALTRFAGVLVLGVETALRQPAEVDFDDTRAGVRVLRRCRRCLGGRHGAPDLVRRIVAELETAGLSVEAPGETH